MMYRCSVELRERFLRAQENHKEAWQMALDHNQPADIRREWETKRDLFELTMRRLRGNIGQ
jgi:hypothetical protein